MKLYEVIVDDGRDVFETVLAAKSERDLLTKYRGNGDFLVIKDVTSDLALTSDTVDCLDVVLRRFGYGDRFRTLVCALLQDHLDNMQG